MALSWPSAQSSVYSLLMCFRLGQLHVQRPVSLPFSKQSEWEQEKTTAVAGSVCCPGTASLSWQRKVWTSFSKHDGSLLASDWKSGNECLQLLISYLLRQTNRIKYILGPFAVFHGIAFLSIGFLPALHHCNSPGSTFSSPNAAVPLVAHNKDMNFLINSSLPKTLQGGMASFYNVKMSMFVACRGQIYSKPEPSSLFHTFKFKGNNVLLWKTRPRSCNKADTDMSITTDAKLWKLPGGKHLVPDTEQLKTLPRCSLQHACLENCPITQPAKNITGNSIYTEESTVQQRRESLWKRTGFW